MREHRRGERLAQQFLDYLLSSRPVPFMNSNGGGCTVNTASWDEPAPLPFGQI